MASLALFWNAFVFCFCTGGHETSGTFGIFTTRTKKEVIVVKQSRVKLKHRRLIAFSYGLHYSRTPFVGKSAASECLRSVAELFRSQHVSKAVIWLMSNESCRFLPLVKRIQTPKQTAKYSEWNKLGMNYLDTKKIIPYVSLYRSEPS